jgi:hypothetical protein
LKRLPAKRVVHYTNLTADPLVVSLHYNTSSGEHPLPPGATSDLLATINVTGIQAVIDKCVHAVQCV